MDHERQSALMRPPVEELIERTQGSKFALVTLAARRARQINSYFSQLGDGLGHMVPPQVFSVARKPLSIAFEEIAAGKIVRVFYEMTEGLEMEDVGFAGLFEDAQSPTSLHELIARLELAIRPEIGWRRAGQRAQVFVATLVELGGRELTPLDAASLQDRLKAV